MSSLPKFRLVKGREGGKYFREPLATFLSCLPFPDVAALERRNFVPVDRLRIRRNLVDQNLGGKYLRGKSRIEKEGCQICFGFLQIRVRISQGKSKREGEAQIEIGERCYELLVAGVTFCFMSLFAKLFALTKVPRRRRRLCESLSISF